MRTTRALAAAVVAGSLVLAPACGDDDDTDIDEELEDIGDETEDLGDEIEDEIEEQDEG